MNLITLDWETYYHKASGYSVRTMTTEAYVRDPRFEEIMVGVKCDAAPTFSLVPDRAREFLRTEVDWANTAMIGHHLHFDGLILSHHHGIVPAMYIDTLSMARVIDGPNCGNRLGDIAERHGLPPKGDEVDRADGKHYDDFTRDEYRQYGAYCVRDVDITYALAQMFIPQLPMSELRLIDLVIRMFTQPRLIGDTAMLAGAVASERARKAELLRRIGQFCPACNGSGVDPIPDMLQGAIACKKCNGTGANKKVVGSNEAFADLLRKCGVEPQMKRSPTPNPDGTPKMIYAFAKTDPAMQGLLEAEDEQVRYLAEARIGIKSAIIETRAQRYHDCAQRGAMPVYIKHAAAHTLRMGGGDSMNWQNLSGVNAKRPEMSTLISAVGAPPGYKLVRTDSSQGEARLIAWQAGQLDLVEAFAQKRDVYSEHASNIFGRPVDRRARPETDYIPGQIGKVSILGMGYSMGWYKAAMELLKGMLGAPPIQFTQKDMEVLKVDPSRFLNNSRNIARVHEMPSRLGLNDRLIHCAVTKALIDRYRAKYQRIVAYWDTCEQVINAMIRGEEMVFGAHGAMRTGKDCIHMPGGLALHYRGIQRDDQGSASYFDGRSRTHIYGGLLTENVTQCLHRIIVCDQMLEIAEVLPVKLMRHDDVVTVVPEDSAEMALQYMTQVMAKTPDWAPGLPLTSEGKIGQALVDVK